MDYQNITNPVGRLSNPEISLPEELTEQQRSLILRYFREGYLFSTKERFAALRGFDLLRKATITIAGVRITFSSIYDAVVENRYADEFIEFLLTAEDVAIVSAKRRLEIGREILTILKNNGYYVPAVPDSRFLAAFCLYWWYAFSKGYAFEVEMIRDLQAAGISFTAHDLRDKKQRFSRTDIRIQNWEGDIKSSMYFLHVERTWGLENDFYITQIFDAQGFRRRVVILQQAVWEEINGETKACRLSNLAETLPTPGHFEHLGKQLVIVDYGLWKQQVKEYQKCQKGGE